jgi:PEP-CTERM motif
MKLSLSTSLLSVAVSTFGMTGVINVWSLKPANAVIFVEPIVTTANQDILKTRNPRRLTDIDPGEVIRYGVPDFANNLLNATGQNMEGFVFDLETLSYSNPNSTPAFNNEPVEWGDVNGDGKIGYTTNPGLQDIFKDVSVTGKTITFSGGEIPDNTVFYNLFESTPNLRPGAGIIPSAPPPPADQDGPIRVASYYTAIPEPSSALALMGMGIFGTAVNLHRKYSRLRRFG